MGRWASDSSIAVLPTPCFRFCGAARGERSKEWALARRAYLAYTMKYGLIFIASAPLLIAYPFVQKYFVQGAMIGSLKG